MLVIKYSKTGGASLVSHIDALRILQRSAKRAGFKVKYSEGFSPHMELSTSLPLPLGDESLCEYMFIDMQSEQSALQRLNDNMPLGFRASRVWQTEKLPPVIALLQYNDYVADCATVNADILKEIADGKYPCVITKKGIEYQTDATGRIKRLEYAEGKLYMTLKAGENNLRPDAVLRLICDKCGDVISSASLKTAQYVNVGGKTVNTDDYLEEICMGHNRL